MNYIYENNRDGKKYILNPEITMGDKVCLVDMSSCEDKFVSPKTLKRWYSKTVTKSTIIELRAFTGMKIGLFVLEYSVNTGALYCVTKTGKVIGFDPDTGKQTNAKNPKFANKIGAEYKFQQVALDWALS